LTAHFLQRPTFFGFATGATATGTAVGNCTGIGATSTEGIVTGIPAGTETGWTIPCTVGGGIAAPPPIAPTAAANFFFLLFFN
jgi:hypothetical protein